MSEGFITGILITASIVGVLFYSWGYSSGFNHSMEMAYDRGCAVYEGKTHLLAWKPLVETP